MKKFSKVTRSLIAVLICLTMVISFASCGKDNTNNDNVTFNMSLSATEISKGNDVTVLGIVTGSEDTSYTVVVKNKTGSDGASLIDITESETSETYILSVNSNVTADKVVTVEGYANANPDKKVQKDLTIKANATGDVGVVAMMVNSKTSARRTYVRKGDEVELKVDISTTSADKGYTVEVTNPADMPNLVSVGADNKITVNGDVTKNTKVTITVIANANGAKTSFQITVKPPKTGDKVGDLTQATIDKLGNLQLSVTGTLSDITVNSGNEKSTSYDFNTYLSAVGSRNQDSDELFAYDFSEASWTSEWYIQGNKDNKLSNTYKRGADGTTKKVYVSKDNVVTEETVTDSYSNELSWDSQRYWNHLGCLELSQFEQDEDNPNLYSYEMDYGTIDTDIILGNVTYTPTEDEYLMMYVAWSLTPMLSQQFYKFYLELDDNHEVSKIIGETYPDDIYNYDDDGNANEKIGYSYTRVEMSVTAYGDEVVMPEIAPYEAPADGTLAGIRFSYLKKAIDFLGSANTKNYTFTMIDNATATPTYDPNDYTVSGGEGVSAPTTSASGTWDGKVHTKSFTSTTGEEGYRGIVTEDAVIINRTIQYSNGGGYRTEVTGYKQNSDNTYDAFEYDSSTAKLVGKSKKQGNISDRLPSFEVSPYIFSFAGMTQYKENSSNEYIYSYALIDAVIIESVAKEFCIKDYARYATGDVSQAFKVNVYVNETTGESRLLGVTFAYNILDSYLGYYHTSYTNFGSTEIPADTFGSANYTPRVTPSSWNDFANVEYLPTSSTPTGSGDKMKGGDLMDKVFGAGAANEIPSPAAFAKVFADNFSVTIWHNYFYTGNVTSSGNETKPDVQFNVWVDDVDLDSNNGLTLKAYNAVIEKLDAEFAKYGFVEWEAGCYNNEGATSKSRIKSYIGEGAGDHGVIIKVENIGYKTFYIKIYNKGDWNPNY